MSHTLHKIGKLILNFELLLKKPLMWYASSLNKYRKSGV